MDLVNFAQPDVTLTLDLTGIIQRAVFSNALSDIADIDWVGRPWSETVAESADSQVRRMLDVARTSGVAPFQEVRQRFPGGEEIAFEYTTVRLGGDAGLLAIGRSLEAVGEVRARLSAARSVLERDSWKMSGVETRYRLLFDTSEQPVVLLDASGLRIVEVNPAAQRTLGIGEGESLLSELRDRERDSLLAMLARVREQGKAPAVVIHLRDDRRPWLVRASFVADDTDQVFILQLSATGAGPRLASTREPRPEPTDLPLADLIARLPEPFVVLSAEGAIARANQAFLDLVEVASPGNVIGRPLDDWMPSSAASSAVGIASLVLELARVRSVREYGTTIRGERGTVSHVAIAAAGNADGTPNFVGLLLRRLDKSNQRAFVRAAVASVEQKCLEAAVRLASTAKPEKA